jgi:CheY-like chemotaxis protein
VKGCDGSVTVESEPGRGTTFRIYLPASGKDVEETRKTKPAQAKGNDELILLVDDEAPIRETGGIFLERHGYRVLTAASGEEAVKVFMEHQNSIRLVLTDIMMPGMSGVALIRALQMLQPSIMVVATSGLGQSQHQAEIAALGVGKVLAKPFTPQELLEAVNQALAR